MSAVLRPDAPSASSNVTGDALASQASAAIRDAGDPSAADRLTESRKRLRSAMMDIAHPPKRQFATGQGLSQMADHLLSRVKAVPGAALVIQSVESWWGQHPLRTAGMVAGEASRTLVSPIARRNPGLLLVGATLAGALFMLMKPWRWLLSPALFVGLVPQIASQAMKRMPKDYWLQIISSLAARSRSGSTRAPATPSRPAATPASPSVATNPTGGTMPQAGSRSAQVTALP